MKNKILIGTICTILLSGVLTIPNNAEAEPTMPAPTEPKIQAVEKYEEETEPKKIEFTVTGYCSCEKCCGAWAKNRPLDEEGKPIVIGASGERLIPKVSVAVDPDVIPYGSVIVMNGFEYVAHDCGGAVKGYAIDIFCETHEEAEQIGKITCTGYIKK